MNIPVNRAPKNIMWLDRILKDFVDRHLLLKGYGFGDPSNNNSEVLEYPYIWFNPTRSRIIANDRTTKSGYSALEMEIEITIADKLISDKSNNVETISDVNEIGYSLISEIIKNPYYVKNNVSLVGDIDIENEWERNDDIVNRCRITMSFRWAFDFCDIPVEYLAPYVAVGYVASGYIFNS